jgi:molybdopterin synthase catalytic subunit
MANPLCEVLLEEAPLEAPKQDFSGGGAIVTFFGIVRGLEDGRPIDGIDYEAHAKMAEHQLRVAATKATENFKLLKVVLRHRVGFVPVGDASLFLQVEAAHRRQAFEASQWIVDELKRTVPIWKHPRFHAGDRGANDIRTEPRRAVHTATK